MSLGEPPVKFFGCVVIESDNMYLVLETTMPHSEWIQAEPSLPLDDLKSSAFLASLQPCDPANDKLRFKYSGKIDSLVELDLLERKSRNTTTRRLARITKSYLRPNRWLNILRREDS
jgi:hypothetical protein